MTELFIDGISVVLPKGFNVQVKRENPLVTKNGEYTYDITLPLTNPTNAELYAHINRLNVTQEVREKRSAILVADNRMYCNGTEIITGWTEKTVTIQIASGNSELNYVIGSDLQISFLKMKETVPAWGDLKYIEKRYPEVEFCLAPLVNQAADHIVNKWGLSRKNVSDELKLVADDAYWYAQPYLCAYIKELFRALGYDMILNQLEDTAFKELYICHAEETNEWNKMIPGWSVQDFLEQIENLFNVVFVIDNRKRSVRILAEGNFFQGVPCVHVRQVKDVYEVEVDKEPEQDTNAASNVQYKFPESAYWRWRCLPDNILKEAKKGTIPADYTPQTFRRLQEWFMDEAHKLTDTIYTDKKDGRQYLYIKDLEDWKNQPVYVMLNEFAPLVREDAVNTIELEMMPAEMSVARMASYSEGVAFEDLDMWIPTVGGTSSEEEVQGTLADQIENNSQQESSGSKDNIYLAFYSGLATFKTLGGLERQFPIPYTDEYRPSGFSTVSEYYQTNTVGASLRLITLDSLFYQGNYDIDFTKGVKIESYDPNLYDAKYVYEIRNKRYICKETEFVIDENGRKGAWTGTFYPIRISDTEADIRWILADGKWRDGGVWIDNGRWLDE
ncbi:hypothetical protein AAE250_16335 [Bacteroides sp. GD17]|jgi:hypothetical protein|uniref:hypothetical protein n=1 Tax=Bacteroides sp. GD17 TaxID=3139826 RepID=UPI002054D268|nr:hypothetical protein [uncultured Bacteroides sp.]DAV67207.1 MAG TPA: hypothetical protein [Caudoviricetes sp.]